MPTHCILQGSFAQAVSSMMLLRQCVELLLLQKTAQFKATSLPGKKAYYRTDESPDVWFEPTEVWEIRGADLTVSPVHKAAVGHIHPDRGISLRSALLKVFYSPGSGFAGLL